MSHHKALIFFVGLWFYFYKGCLCSLDLQNDTGDYMTHDDKVECLLWLLLWPFVPIIKLVAKVVK
jgi:hypothetical protein